MRIYVEERSPLRNTLQRDKEILVLPERQDNTLCQPSRRIITGFARLITLDGKFTVETMDYTFSRPIGMSYHIRKGFIELVYLESAQMVNREYGTGEFNIGKGLYIYRNQGKPGEFIVLPGVPVRGIRIQVLEEFYRDYLKDKFPVKELDSLYLSALNNKPYTSPPLRLVFEQIKLSMNTGVDYELYYESKISELLCLLAAEVSGIRILSENKRSLSKTDLEAMNRTKILIDKRLSKTLKISELARLTGRCVTKLQSDFKAAFGCTIHDYLQKARMTAALSKISNTEIPLYAISREVGFKQQSRFTETFKRTYGVTPTEYRNIGVQSRNDTE